MTRLVGGGWQWHDRRWRRSREIFSPNTRIFQGNAGLALVQQAHEGATLCSVIEVASPNRVLASGTFSDGWHFDGDSHAWAEVPEYLLVEGDERPALLRIADEAELDLLEEIGRVDVVATIPGSRLVALAGEGRLTVWDPQTSKALAHMKLESETPHPYLSFRQEGRELLVNDAQTLVKLETKQWRPKDAAGSEAEGPAIDYWSYDFGSDVCVVLPSKTGEVIVLSGETLMPITRLATKSNPVAAQIRNGSMLVLLESGAVTKKRLVEAG